jgi:hypothetical protein
MYMEVTDGGKQEFEVDTVLALFRAGESVEDYELDLHLGRIINAHVGSRQIVTERELVAILTAVVGSVEDVSS